MLFKHKKNRVPTIGSSYPVGSRETTMGHTIRLCFMIDTTAPPVESLLDREGVDQFVDVEMDWEQATLLSRQLDYFLEMVKKINE